MNKMQTLYEGRFLRIDYDSDLQLAHNVWLPETREMNDDDFKQEISVWLRMAIQKGFKSTLVDTIEFRNIISPQLNEWYNKHITPPAFEAGVKRLGFLLPEGIFAHMSIEQIFEEGYENSMSIRYFANKGEAIAWLTDIEG